MRSESRSLKLAAALAVLSAGMSESQLRAVDAVAPPPDITRKPYRPTNHMPHQGKREMERRRRQMSRDAAKRTPLSTPEPK